MEGVGRGPVRPVPKRREGRQIAAGFLDRGTGRLHRARGWPVDYGAWYISQVLDILVSHPEVFSKTVFIINYDEADGSFDHMVPPTPPQTPGLLARQRSASKTRSSRRSTPQRPDRPRHARAVPCDLALEQGRLRQFPGLRSHVGDPVHREAVRGLSRSNISPWRRAVTGDLTSVFNFANPNDVSRQTAGHQRLSAAPYRTRGRKRHTLQPTLNSVILGVPPQEKGIRPARALPYELDVHASVNASNSTVRLTFFNTGGKAAVFQVRSDNAADSVRDYTVEPGKTLTGTWKVASSYHLKVYGPNGFVRYFHGSIGAAAAALHVRSRYESEDDCGSIKLRIINVAANQAEVSVLDAYTGRTSTQLLQPRERFEDEWSLDQFHGWYDLIVTVVGDPTFKYRLAGHVETGRDSFSDPALGGLVTLKG